MNTHIHLAVSVPEADKFSDAMKWVKNEYTRYYNKKHQRRGPLWQSRFKSLLIENENYLHACGLYIENNPVEVGMVSRREDWSHSSSQHYEKLSSDEIVDGYEADLSTVDPLEKSLLDGPAIGSSYFKYQVKQGELPVPK